MTLKNVLFQYSYQKLNNGYEPNSSKNEIIDFLYYFEQFTIIDDIMKDRCELTKELDGDLFTVKDDLSVVPTYNFADDDLKDLKRLNNKQRNELEITIDNYLKKLPKRSSKKLEYSKEEIEFSKHATSLIIDFIWENYINYYIEKGKWPIQCRDINKYLLENDLASLIEVPSIKKIILKFYEETTLKFATMKKEDPNFKLSGISDSLLAKANSNFITDGYEELFKYTRKRTIEIDAGTNEFTNRACADGVFINENVIYSDISLRKENIGNSKSKKIIETINNLEK